MSLELLRVWKSYQRGKPPKRIQQVGFWVTWIAVAMFAGFVAAVVYGTTDRKIAFHIGISLPLIIEAGSRKTPDE